MAIATVTNSTTAAGGTAAAAATGSAAANQLRLSGNFDTFLTLLTTQLKNQSPDDPLDTNQMTQQLVQFASVEQQIAMNGNLGQMIGLQQAAQLTASAPLLGRTVEVTGNTLPLQGGAAQIRLPAAGEATRARIAITDTSGRTVRTEEVSLGSGRTTWKWNGLDSAGNRMTDGGYGVAVSGVRPNGEAATAAVDWTALGTVTSTERQNNALRLMLGGAAYGFDQVRSVTSGG